MAIILKHINYTAKGKVMLNFYTNKIMTLKDFFLIIMKSVMSTPIDHAELGLVLPEIQWADRHNISLAEGQWYVYNGFFFKSVSDFRTSQELWLWRVLTPNSKETKLLEKVGLKCEPILTFSSLSQPILFGFLIICLICLSAFSEVH